MSGILGLEHCDPTHQYPHSSSQISPDVNELTVVTLVTVQKEDTQRV